MNRGKKWNRKNNTSIDFNWWRTSCDGFRIEICSLFCLIAFGWVLSLCETIELFTESKEQERLFWWWWWWWWWWRWFLSSISICSESKEYVLIVSFSETISIIFGVCSDDEISGVSEQTGMCSQR